MWGVRLSRTMAGAYSAAAGVFAQDDAACDNGQRPAFLRSTALLPPPSRSSCILHDVYHVVSQLSAFPGRSHPKYASKVIFYRRSCTKTYTIGPILSFPPVQHPQHTPGTCRRYPRWPRPHATASSERIGLRRPTPRHRRCTSPTAPYACVILTTSVPRTNDARRPHTTASRPSRATHATSALAPAPTRNRPSAPRSHATPPQTHERARRTSVHPRTKSRCDPGR